MAIARVSPRLLRAASDERLVALTRAGVDAAFEAIYDRHHRQVLSFCRHMLGSHTEGEDAVQQTFLSAHRALLASEEPMQLRAWLHTIARNRCVSMLRARRDQPTEEPGEVATAGLAEVVQRREDLRDLLADLTALPEEQRAALVLAELGSLSHDEIAGVLGVPRVKVKALVFQARESLIAFRSAREADCRDIREQLATLSGGALRRAPLRRHLAVCEGCRAYKAEVARQRSALAILLPVAPSAALKHGVLSGGGTAGAGGGLVAAGAKSVAVKVAVTTAVAATAAGGTVVAVEDRAPARADAPAAAAVQHAAHVASAPAHVASQQPEARPQRAAAPPRSQRTPAARDRPRPQHTATPAATTHPTAPGRSASTPSRTGATPAHANPVPGVPRGQARGHSQVHPAKPVKVKPVKVKPVKVHPAKPAKPKPAVATEPHGKSNEPHGKSNEPHGKADEPHGKAHEPHGNGGPKSDH